MNQRLMMRRWGPANNERVLAAEVITGPTRHGVIDGVVIDFRHDMVAADDWEPRPWWHFASDSQGSAGLSFPSDDSLVVPPLRSAKLLQPGDAVTVQNVSRLHVGPLFLHEHDSYVLSAEIVIHRNTGATERGGNLTLFGSTALRSAPEHEAFDRMSARIRAMLDLEKVGDFPLPHFAAQKEGLVEEAAYFLKGVDGGIRSMSSALEMLDEADDPAELLKVYLGPGWWRGGLLNLVNRALLSGYFLARSETDSAESALELKRNRDEVLQAGRLALKDYDGRRVRAQEIWQRHPRYTINRVATEVARELGKDKASVMASLWSEVPETSPSYSKALQKVMAGLT